MTDGVVFKHHTVHNGTSPAFVHSDTRTRILARSLSCAWVDTFMHNTDTTRHRRHAGNTLLLQSRLTKLRPTQSHFVAMAICIYRLLEWTRSCTTWTLYTRKPLSISTTTRSQSETTATRQRTPALAARFAFLLNKRLQQSPPSSWGRACNFALCCKVP